jgi:hypothetical protein
VSSLPPELAAWTEALSTFAPDLREALGGLARRLDLVIGRVRARPKPRGDDPDGYDGLARKGLYDRLLLSEWALATEVPEEFDRRAVSGEHAFLRLDLRDRRKGVRTVALFDGGPTQLGGPRLVQLAALVTLERRAALANAEFAWGMLGSTGDLTRTVDRSTVQTFLAGRHARATTDDDLDAGMARAQNPDELWLVGVEPRGDGALCLALRDVLEPGTDAVDVVLFRRGARLGEARLTLPTGALGRRLLTDPFPPPTSQVRPAAGTPKPAPTPAWAPLPNGLPAPLDLRFAPATRQMLVVFPNNQILAWGVQDGRLRSPKPKHHAFVHWPMLGLGYGSQTVDVLLAAEDKGKPTLSRSWTGLLALDGTPMPAVGAGQLARRGDVWALVDVQGQLYTSGRSLQTPLDANRGRALFPYPLQTDVFVVVRTTDGLAITKVGFDGALGPLEPLPGTRPDQEVLYLVDARTAEHHSTIFFLAHGGEGAPRLFVHNAGWTSGRHVARPLEPGPGILVGARLDTTEVGVLTWNAGDQTLYRGDAAVLTPERTPLAIRVSHDGRLAAWHTAEGMLEVWSLDTGKPLLQRYPA